MQGVVRGEALAGVERKPALPTVGLGAVVPGNGQRLQATTRAFDQVLLQGINAEGVGHGEVLASALFVFGIDVKRAIARAETHLYAGGVRKGLIGEVAPHIVRGRLAHRPAVM